MILVQTDDYSIDLIVKDERGEVVDIEPTAYRKLFYDAHAWPFRRASQDEAVAA